MHVRSECSLLVVDYFFQSDPLLIDLSMVLIQPTIFFSSDLKVLVSIKFKLQFLYTSQFSSPTVTNQANSVTKKTKISLQIRLSTPS